MISILIPTYGRATRIQRVVSNVLDATPESHEIIVIVEKEERAEYDSYMECLLWMQNLYIVTNKHTPNYAGAIQTGYNHSIGKYIFCGADDLNFHPDWWHSCQMNFSGPNVRVSGTNDLFNKFVLEGQHATHFAVDRTYISGVGGVIDGGPGSFLNTAYDHNYTDTEFIETAKSRGVFAPDLTAIVEHMHWIGGKNPDGEDATAVKTYRKLGEDRCLYESREGLWSVSK